MIRNTFLCIIVLAFCLLTVYNFTIAVEVIESESDSGMGMVAAVERDPTVKLFNNFQEFYDKHHLEISVFAGVKYDGSYVGDCYVTGNGERDEDFLGGGGDIYYLGGAADKTGAYLLFEDQPNVDVSGEGYGWCRIRGTTGTQQHEEEASSQFYFNGNSSDITPNCGSCTDANSDCPNANNRHFGP